MGKISVYEMVTNQIIEKLESGVVPWRKPWTSASAVNWVTQKAYRGINVMLLEPGEYATFKQISEAGGKVKKGESGHIVVFWKWLEKENDEGKIEQIPMLRYYKVFEINTQVEGLESKRKDIQEFENDPVEEAEKIVNGYINAPTYSFQPGEAYYQPFFDKITMPPIKHFHSANEFYSTLFHEMIHSTGHKSRLNREGITAKASFGSELYSKEELVAEMGAAMLCGISGIVNETIDNSASYINGWLRALKNDKRLVVTAAAQAQKASDLILGE